MWSLLCLFARSVYMSTYPAKISGTCDGNDTFCCDKPCRNSIHKESSVRPTLAKGLTIILEPIQGQISQTLDIHYLMRMPITKGLPPCGHRSSRTCPSRPNPTGTWPSCTREPTALVLLQIIPSSVNGCMFDFFTEYLDCCALELGWHLVGRHLCSS
jgi:hypothetical protein